MLPERYPKMSSLCWSKESYWSSGKWDKRTAIGKKVIEKNTENTRPISLLQHIDDILWACAALCNLKPKLICSKKEDKSNVWLINKPFANLFGLQ